MDLGVFNEVLDAGAERAAQGAVSKLERLQAKLASTRETMSECAKTAEEYRTDASRLRQLATDVAKGMEALESMSAKIRSEVDLQVSLHKQTRRIHAGRAPARLLGAEGVAPRVVRAPRARAADHDR